MSADDLTETLAAMRATAEAATEGPWEAECDDGEGEVVVNAGTALTEWHGDIGRPAHSWLTSDRILEKDDLYDDEFEQVAADAEFIAQSRTIVPKLLSAVEAVLALCESLDADHDAYDSKFDAGVVSAADAVRKALTDALGGE